MLGGNPSEIAERLAGQFDLALRGPPDGASLEVYVSKEVVPTATPTLWAKVTASQGKAATRASRQIELLGTPKR